MEMTEQQLQVINQVNGHLVVLAGPGSGKTRTVIEKIFHLFSKSIVSEPFGILAITFTNAAANEMKARLRQKGFSAWDRLTIATFHSFGRYLLSCYGSDVGVNENFEIADPKQQYAIINEIKPNSSQREISSIMEAIEAQKRLGVYPGEKDEKISASFRQIYEAYQNYLRQSNLLDYGDLIHYSILLMRKSDLASRLFTNFYKYIFVDEFQDTDYQQLDLIKIFAENAVGSTIVADDDQSVFAWRGADRRNIKTITKDLKAETYQLGINFRSDQAIVKAASAVINQDKNREEKNIQANSHSKGRIYLKCFSDEDQEANAIASRIKDYKREGIIENLGQIAVIVRVRYRATKIREILSARDITWFDRSCLTFDDGWETALALSIIGQACEPNSSKRLQQLLSSVDMSGIANHYGDALDLVASIRNDICCETPSDLSQVAIHHILDLCNFWNLIKENCWSDIDFNSRSRNIEKLIENIERVAREYNLELLGTIDHLAGLGAVQILSGQESKGREFDHVFFAGLEEGTIPYYKAKNEDKISEERRIFYVAMTRAKKELYLSYANEREMPRGGKKQQRPSRFIAAIPTELLYKTKSDQSVEEQH